MTIKPGNPARKQKAALHARACSLCGRCSQHHPHPLLEGTQAAEGSKRSCVWLLLDYTFKDCSEHECVHWMWNNWGIFKAPTVLLLVITPLPHHHVADIFFPVPKMLEVPCSPYLICQERRPSWKHFLSSVAVYPISTPTNCSCSQSRQFLKRIWEPGEHTARQKLQLNTGVTNSTDFGFLSHTAFFHSWRIADA